MPFILLAVLAGCSGAGRAPAAPPASQRVTILTPAAAPAGPPVGTLTPTAGGTFSLPTPVPRPAIPNRLIIPSIHVNAPVEEVGNTASGAMDVPRQWMDAAWYDLGYRPGQDGNAVIEGHLDSTSAPAVFWNLHALKPGDSVTVDRADGSVVQFAVTRLTSYSNDAAPLAAIFGAAATPRLNLITCSGAWDKATKEYGQRLVVSATEVATPVAASRPR